MLNPVGAVKSVSLLEIGTLLRISLEVTQFLLLQELREIVLIFLYFIHGHRRGYVHFKEKKKTTETSVEPFLPGLAAMASGDAILAPLSCPSVLCSIPPSCTKWPSVPGWCFGGLAITFQLPCSLPVPTPTQRHQSIERVAVTRFLLSRLEMCCLHGPQCPSGLPLWDCLSAPMLVAWKGPGSHCPQG